MVIMREKKHIPVNGYNLNPNNHNRRDVTFLGDNTLGNILCLVLKGHVFCLTYSTLKTSWDCISRVCPLDPKPLINEGII